MNWTAKILLTISTLKFIVYRVDVCSLCVVLFAGKAEDLKPSGFNPSYD